MRHSYSMVAVYLCDNHVRMSQFFHATSTFFNVAVFSCDVSVFFSMSQFFHATSSFFSVVECRSFILRHCNSNYNISPTFHTSNSFKNKIKGTSYTVHSSVKKLLELIERFFFINVSIY